MVFGFPAWHSTTLPYAIAPAVVEATLVKKLYCRLLDRTSNKYIFKRDIDTTSDKEVLLTGNIFGEKITITFNQDSTVIRCESGLITQCIDFGKNKRTVNILIKALPPPLPRR